MRSYAGASSSTSQSPAPVCVTGDRMLPVDLPAKLLYGTAWKKDRTAALVVQAVRCGFRSIDTACQPKHYNEKGVGEALQVLRENDGIARDQLYVQTKFTPISGHDNRVPYDPGAPVAEQVRQSLQVSLRNLQTTYLDALILHSPFSDIRDTIEAWHSMEQFVPTGVVRSLGISNCYDLRTLEQLCKHATVQPSIVQNRFYADTGYDVELRRWCRLHRIRYQSFWTLTANPQILSSPEVLQFSSKYGKTPPQVLFRYLTLRGVDPLTGTTSIEHMKEDLDIFSFHLSEQDLGTLDRLFS